MKWEKPVCSGSLTWMRTRINRLKTTLQYMTAHVYFWVQNGVCLYDTQEMKALIDTFENKIYPTNREFFGSE